MDEKVTVEQVLDEMPVGHTLLIHRTPDGYRVQIRNDVRLKSYESAFSQAVEGVGDVSMYVMVADEN